MAGGQFLPASGQRGYGPPRVATGTWPARIVAHGEMIGAPVALHSAIISPDSGHAMDRPATVGRIAENGLFFEIDH